MSTISIDTSRVDEAVIIMSRLFDAPIDTVWECFTKPEHVKVWFGGAGFSNKVLEMDVRPGGHWRHVMIPPGGQEFHLDYVYMEVKKPTRLVWQSADFGSRKDGPPANRTDITLEDQGARTKWTMTATFQSMADRDLAVKMGYTSTLSQGCEKLNDEVKRMLAAR